MLATESDAVADEAGPLARFVLHRDGEAFADLVKRHGPLVMAICRRTTRDAYLAEEAFQAVFLTLARRAADVRPQSSLRPWLFGVAVRTAREIRAVYFRRRAWERNGTTLPERPGALEDRLDHDVLEALDEEIARLPSFLRSAVVLCELDGVGRREAANRIGVREGTLSSRLAKARKLLGERLRRRGVTLTTAGVAPLLQRTSNTAPIRAELARSAASCSAANFDRPIGAVGLFGRIRAMMQTTCTWALNGAVAAVVFLAIAAAVVPDAHPEGASAHPTPAKPREIEAAEPGKIFFSRDDRFYVMNADGTNERRILLPSQARGSAIPSPDGRSLAYWTHGAGNAKKPAAVWIRGVDEHGDGRRIDLPTGGFGYLKCLWSADGKEVLVSGGKVGVKGVTHYQADVAAKTAAPLNFPAAHLLDDCSTDGKRLLTTFVGDNLQWAPQSLHLTNRRGGEDLVLTAPNNHAFHGRLSPDGKRILCVSEQKLSLVRVGEPASMQPLEGAPADAEVIDQAWSPTGKRIVFTTGSSLLLEPDELQALESRLIVADPDGRNAVLLRFVKGESFGLVHWRP